MFRRLIRHPASQAAISRLLGLYLALVFRTTRWTLLGQEHLQAALGAGAGRPILAAFWHERLPMMPMLWLRARARSRGWPGCRRMCWSPATATGASSARWCAASGW
ncbi:hypothetical protein ACFQY5_19980 [Paeniroseomonas aquatica]|uniref:hypothetical protein n=1 Tax=Paeniroseomonas aquatica TaxID=373043 RepID=UPI0036098B9E